MADIQTVGGRAGGARAGRAQSRRGFLRQAGAGLALFAVAGPLAAGPGWGADISLEAVFHDPDAPALGNPEGDVTLVEYFDYQCPYCKSNHHVIEALMAEDRGLRVVMKDWPIFGAASVRASQLVLGAQEMGKYAPALEALMATPGRLSAGEIDRVLGRAGVDPARAEAGYRGTRQRIDALLARNNLQALAIGLRGTPAYIVGHDAYAGVVDGATLRAAIAQARKG